MVILYMPLGLVCFLAGMKLMTAGLETMYGTSFAGRLQQLTANRLRAFLCGLLFTCLTQSSSLATVLVVGVVDAGLLALAPAIAVIIGANVGTTVTGQILSFQLHDCAAYIVGAGLAMMVFFPGKRGRQAGRALTGLGVLLSGLKMMSISLVPLAGLPWFGSLLSLAAVHPFAGVLAGAAATAVIQSSSAVVGMVLLMAREGILTLGAGAGVIVGADVGTCVTSLLAGLGTGVNARRAAASHLLFNIFSVMFVMPLFPVFVAVAERTGDSLPRQLANAHTIYNLAGAVVLLLLFAPFQALVEKVVKAENRQEKRISSIFGEYVARWF